MIAEDEMLNGPGLAGKTADDRSEDRREYPRVAMLSSVTVRIAACADHGPGGGQASGELIRSSWSGDVSLGGMFLEAGEPVARGTPVEVAFGIPDGDAEMTIPAEIRWTRKPGARSDSSPWKFGVGFLDLNDRQHDQIEAFISRRRS